MVIKDYEEVKLTGGYRLEDCTRTDDGKYFLCPFNGKPSRVHPVFMLDKGDTFEKVAKRAVHDLSETFISPFTGEEASQGDAVYYKSYEGMIPSVAGLARQAAISQCG